MSKNGVGLTRPLCHGQQAVTLLLDNNIDSSAALAWTDLMWTLWPLPCLPSSRSAALHVAGKTLGENPQSAAVIGKLSIWLRAGLAKETDMWRLNRLPCGDAMAVGQKGGCPVAAPTHRRSCCYSETGLAWGSNLQVMPFLMV